MNDINDNELLKRITKKDEDAFNILVQKYKKLFYTIIIRIFHDELSEEDIADCFAESMIFIWDYIKHCKPSEITVRNWCCLAVIGRAENYLHKYQRQHEKIKKYESEIVENCTFEDSAETIYFKKWEQNDLVNKYLHGFSKIAQQVFILRYIYNLKPRMISQTMNITEKQINNYLTYIKKKLRKNNWLDM